MFVGPGDRAGRSVAAINRTAFKQYAQPVAIPVKGGWTDTNSAGTISTDTAKGILFAPAASGATWRTFMATPPPAPWSFVVRMAVNAVANGNAISGISLRNSTNARQVSWGPYIPAGDTPEGLCQQMTSFSAFSGNTIVALVPQMYTWWRVDLASTTLRFYASEDGFTWREYTPTQTFASFLTASGGGTLDQVGFGVLEYSGQSTLFSSASFSLPIP